MNLIFKRATIEDLDVLTKTRVEVLRAANELDGSVDLGHIERASREYYLRALRANTHTAWLVFDDDAFVGAGGISYYEVMPTCDVPTGLRAYIMNMYVRPDHRRRGIASRVLDLLVRDARDRGVDCIALEATRMGRPLYEHYGFESMPNEMGLPAICHEEDR